MSVIDNIILRSKNKKAIVADLHLVDYKNCPVVIFCHGYKGFKDWGDTNLRAREISDDRFHFLKFNFSHNGGTEEQVKDFPDLEAFSDNNFSIELDDIKRVVDWVDQGDHVFKEFFNTNKIYLMGYSRGGANSIIYASEDERIKKLVTWSTVSALERRFPSGSKLENWKKDGVMYIENTRTKQMMPHKYQFYKDFVLHRSRLNVSEAEKRLKIPHLLIHGTKDETVYLGEALHLMSLNENTSLIKIKNGTHTLGGYHPYTSEKLSPHATAAVNSSIAFL